jgi:RNA polymerase sigma-70 factor, ECF subfamily
VAVLRRDPLATPEPLIRRVYSYVAYRIGDGPDAEDVTSETFAQALRYRSSYDERRGEPVAWLLGIARRIVAQHLAARVDATAEVPESVDLAELADDTARRLDLAHAVGLLDERDRELVALRYGADLTARQIGTLLELRTNAVEVALHRALARLREVLDGEVARPDTAAPPVARAAEKIVQEA